jgi:hypothetical protein
MALGNRCREYVLTDANPLSRAEGLAERRLSTQVSTNNEQRTPITIIR